MKTITKRIQRLEHRKPGNHAPPIIVRQCTESREPLWATCENKTIEANPGESLNDFEARAIETLAPNAAQVFILPAKVAP